MVDVLVSTLLEKLASTTYQYVADEVKLVLNVKKEVEEFTSNLEAIESVLEDAEHRQIKEANVQNWLDNLKEISYQMVDVLDEWNTEILRQQVEKQEREGVTRIASQRKNDLFLSLIAPRVWFTSTSRPSGSRVTRNWAWIQNLLLNATAVDMHGKEDYENFLSYVCNACNGTTALKACSRFSLSTIQNESSKSTRSVGYNEGNMAAVRGRIGSTITSWIRQMNLAILIWTFMV
nr:uncharacterized protein LOC103418513 [Malus domestica]